MSAIASSSMDNIKCNASIYNTNNEVYDVHLRIRLVPDGLYDKLVLIWPISWLVILPFGVWTNGLNIRTFLRMGLDDSVTISFFLLAVSDFLTVFFSLANIVNSFLIFVEKNFPVVVRIQPLAVYFYFGNVSCVFTMWTSLITAFLSVQKCLCILMPLQFKTMFTKQRTWSMMTFFCIYSTVPAIMYLFFTYDMRPVEVSANKTQYVMMMMQAYRQVQRYSDIIFYMSTNIACQLLSFSSLVTMAYTLAASVKFRKSATIQTIAKQKGKSRCDNEARDVGDARQEKHNVEVENQRQSSKERTAVVQVSLLAVIFLATRLPQIGLSIASLNVPKFGINKPLNNLYIFIGFLRLTGDYVNAAVNMLVYYKYNTRFRRLCFNKEKK